MQFRWLAVLGAVSVLLGAASPAFAGKGDYGRYLGFRFIGSFAEVDDTKSQNFNGALQINNDTDIVAKRVHFRLSLEITTDMQISRCISLSLRSRFARYGSTGARIREQSRDAQRTGQPDVRIPKRHQFCAVFRRGCRLGAEPFQRSAVRSIKWRRAKFRRTDAQFCMGRTSWVTWRL